MKLSDFKTNKDKEVDGVWHDLSDETRVLVARARNSKYIKLMRDRLKPYQNRIDRNDPTMESTAEKIITEIMAQTILLGWEGLVDEKDKKIEYSVEKCIEILANEDYKDFRDLIEALADDMSSYQDKEQERIVGNSKSS